MNRTIITMGLQASGKTTFLAAFWNVVEFEDIGGSLHLLKTTGDMQYLNEIRIAWANCEPIVRTGPAGDRPVTMQLMDSSTNITTELAWTDMRGEKFESQWTDRSWTMAYQDLVDSSVGMLLFVHPRKINESPLIIDAMGALSQLSNDSSSPTTTTQTEAVGGATHEGKAPETPKVEGPLPKEVVIPYDPLKVATQVQLVELLQFVSARRENRRPLRLAVIVSAWDLVEKLDPDATPEAWVARALPLLRQFIDTNNGSFESMVFGVSAQGGDYKDAAALQKFHKASERIKVVFKKETSHDITTPVRWSLGPQDT